MVTALAAGVALKKTLVSYVNRLVGIWVLMSALLLPATSYATRWHNLIVGVLITIASLAPAPGSGVRRGYGSP